MRLAFCLFFLCYASLCANARQLVKTIYEDPNDACIKNDCVYDGTVALAAQDFLLLPLSNTQMLDTLRIQIESPANAPAASLLLLDSTNYNHFLANSTYEASKGSIISNSSLLPSATVVTERIRLSLTFDTLFVVLYNPADGFSASAAAQYKFTFIYSANGCLTFFLLVFAIPILIILAFACFLRCYCRNVRVSSSSSVKHFLPVAQPVISSPLSRTDRERAYTQHLLEDDSVGGSGHTSASARRGADDRDDEFRNVSLTVGERDGPPLGGLVAADSSVSNSSSSDSFGGGGMNVMMSMVPEDVLLEEKRVQSATSCRCCVYRPYERSRPGKPCRFWPCLGRRVCGCQGMCCFEAILARPICNYHHWWRQQVIFTWPWNPPVDETLLLFRDRLAYFVTMTVFNLLVLTVT